MIECRKKHEQMEFRYAEAQTAAIEMAATLDEQKEKKAFLLTKIEKWTNRVETYSKPVKVKQKIVELEAKIKDIKDTIAKEEVSIF